MIFIICSFVSAKTLAVEKVDERREVAHAEMKACYAMRNVLVEPKRRPARIKQILQTKEEQYPVPE